MGTIRIFDNAKKVVVKTVRVCPSSIDEVVDRLLSSNVRFTIEVR